MKFNNPMFVAGALAFGLMTNRAAAQAGGNPEQEIKELMKKVEKDLQEIDKLLLQAAKDSPGAAAASAGENKTAATQAHTRQKSVSEAIQKIIDLIPPSGNNSSSSNQSKRGLSKPNQGNGKGNQPPPDGNQQKDDGQQQQGKGEQQKENTAEGAGQAPTLPKDSQGEKQPQGQDDPNDNKKSNEDPRNGTKKAKDYETEKLNRGKENPDRWGDLPEHLRRTFSNENTDDLPMRYRKWIQDFYSRSSKSSTTGGGK